MMIFKQKTLLSEEKNSRFKRLFQKLSEYQIQAIITYKTTYHKYHTPITRVSYLEQKLLVRRLAYIYPVDELIAAGCFSADTTHCQKTYNHWDCICYHYGNKKCMFGVTLEK